MSVFFFTKTLCKKMYFSEALETRVYAGVNGRNKDEAKPLVDISSPGQIDIFSSLQVPRPPRFESLYQSYVRR